MPSAGLWYTLSCVYLHPKDLLRWPFADSIKSGAKTSKWSKYLDSDEDDDLRDHNHITARAAYGVDDEEDSARIIKSNILKLTTQEVIDEEDSGFSSKMTFSKTPATAGSKTKITETLRDSCLPKMLCEMAARPNQLLNDREKDLLSLIK